MGKDILAKDLIDAGQRLVSLLEARDMKVRSALWMHEPEDATWRLFLATDGADQDLLAEYLTLSTVIHERAAEVEGMSSSDVRIVSRKDPVLRLMRRGLAKPVKPLTRWQRNTVDGTLIEDALIYRLAA